MIEAIHESYNIMQKGILILSMKLRLWNAWNKMTKSSKHHANSPFHNSVLISLLNYVALKTIECT